MPAENNTYQILLYYKFVPIEHPEHLLKNTLTYAIGFS